MPEALEQPGILVTATSANHLLQVAGLVRSAQLHLPTTWRVVVYDLIGDLRQADARRVSAWCGTEYRAFDALTYRRRANGTWEPRVLNQGWWKPFIIEECLAQLPPGGVVMYADTSTRLHEPLTAALLHAVRSVGVVGRTTFSPLSLYTHPQMPVELSQLVSGNYAFHTNLTAYSRAPTMCGCTSFWSANAFIVEEVLKPWISCVARPACIFPRGAQGFSNRIKGLSSRCKPGLQGTCHRGDQSALSMLLYEAFGARSNPTKLPPYLANVTVGSESFQMCRASYHGTLITTERSSGSSKDLQPLANTDSMCRLQGNVSKHQRLHGSRRIRLDTHHFVPSETSAECSRLTLTRVAVPTGIQPIFPGMGGPQASLKRLLRPCRSACTLASDGCVVSSRGKHVVIGRCNSTHGVEYEHRDPGNGPAIISFFNPSKVMFRQTLDLIANAQPRLFVEFEPSIHARVPQSEVLRRVDGFMSYTRDSLVRFPYFSSTQLWQTAQRANTLPGFEERLPVIATFVSNCRGTFRGDVMKWLQRHFEVHSYGSCGHHHHANRSEAFNVQTRRQARDREGGHRPECLRYRIVLAVENNACRDYVSEKLFLAADCGAVPIVRTFNGVPDYYALLGKFPFLDAKKLDEQFAHAVRRVLTDRDAWEAMIPAYNSSVVPSEPELLKTGYHVANPHCQLIDLVARHNASSNQRASPIAHTNQRAPQSRHFGAFDTEIQCETGYTVPTPHGMVILPRKYNRSRPSALAWTS